MRLERMALAVVPLLALALAGSGTAQSIDGSLLQRGTHDPVTDAAVLLVDGAGAATVTTESDTVGHFHVQAPEAGIYRLRIERVGYPNAVTPALELRDSDRVDVTIRLSADTVALAPIKVVAHSRRPRPTLHGFRGRDGAAGRLITREQIEEARPFVVTDLLRGVAGLTFLPSFGSGYRVFTNSGCAPAVYMDGLRYPLLGETIDDIVSPMDLDAIEVYTTAAEVPVEYSEQGRACAAILLWTRGLEWNLP